MKKLLTLSAVMITVFLFSNCHSTRKAAAAPAKLNYTTHIQTLVATHCSPCHIPSKGGRKKDYSTFAAVQGDIDAMIQRIELNPGDRGFMPFKGSKLSDTTINAFKQWKADGLLEK